jgi:hypothetical protein
MRVTSTMDEWSAPDRRGSGDAVDRDGNASAFITPTWSWQICYVALRTWQEDDACVESI